MRELVGESFTLIIDMAKVKAPSEDEAMRDENWENPNVEARVEQVYRQREDVVMEEENVEKPNDEMINDSNLEGQKTDEPNSGVQNE